MTTGQVLFGLILVLAVGSRVLVLTRRLVGFLATVSTAGDNRGMHDSDSDRPACWH